jgi:alkylation response protein AidB-like acyl-CoA dehydrogenase
MSHPLLATTAAGARLVALASELATGAAEHASAHDRDGSYPFDSLGALRDAGYLGAPIPVELGGLGVDSVHDLVVASSRLARGDASLAIGVNMHIIAVQQMARRWRIAVASGNERRASAFAASLRAVADEHIVMAAAISEPQQDLLRPSTVAQRVNGGWRIDGRKVFCTMSPAATVLYTAVTFANGDGTEHYGYAQIPADASGVVIHDDWDALGMRASGSHSVSFEGVELPAVALRGGFTVGELGPYVERNLSSGLFHAAASLGIAEAAHDEVVAALRRRPADDGRARTLLAENTMELGAVRAFLSRAAALVDEHYAANPTSDGSEEQLVEVFAEGQAAKTYVNETCVKIVDRALALSGGGGYRSASPLSRAYRDVRAGAFMHPFGANRAYDFLGRIALGQEPTLR